MHASVSTLSGNGMLVKVVNTTAVAIIVTQSHIELVDSLVNDASLRPFSQKSKSENPVIVRSVWLYGEISIEGDSGLRSSGCRGLSTVGDAHFTSQILKSRENIIRCHTVDEALRLWLFRYLQFLGYVRARSIPAFKYAFFQIHVS